MILNESIKIQERIRLEQIRLELINMWVNIDQTIIIIILGVFDYREN